MVVSSLTALCDMLRNQTEAQVTIGLPNESGSGIYVWPYLFHDKPQDRNVRPSPDGRRLPPSIGMTVHLLILVWPALTQDGLSKLEAVHRAIINQPILEVVGKSVEIVMENLDIQTLSGLFLAAKLPLTTCLGVALTIIEEGGGPQ